MKRIHEEFKNRISDELYEELDEAFAKIDENKDGLIIKLADKKMKKSIQYLRRCNLVKIILEDENKSDIERFWQIWKMILKEITGIAIMLLTICII